MNTRQIGVPGKKCTALISQVKTMNKVTLTRTRVEKINKFFYLCHGYNKKPFSDQDLSSDIVTFLFNITKQKIKSLSDLSNYTEGKSFFPSLELIITGTMNNMNNMNMNNMHMNMNMNMNYQNF